MLRKSYAGLVSRDLMILLLAPARYVLYDIRIASPTARVASMFSTSRNAIHHHPWFPEMRYLPTFWLLYRGRKYVIV